jgi:chaperone modulatory protein CbpM
MPDYYFYAEVIETYRINEAFLQQCLQNQWVEPLDKAAGKLAQEDVARLLLIRDLMEDMGVNDESVPVILNLIDQIHALKSRVRLLGEHFKDRPAG